LFVLTFSQVFGILRSSTTLVATLDHFVRSLRLFTASGLREKPVTFLKTLNGIYGIERMTKGQNERNMSKETKAT